MVAINIQAIFSETTLILELVHITCGMHGIANRCVLPTLLPMSHNSHKEKKMS